MSILTSALLTEAGFVHGFTTRSTGDFARGEDDPGPLIPCVRTCSQVHGAEVFEVDDADPAQVPADALIARKGAAVAIRVADCVPILIADVRRGHVAAVHAGWRGVVAGVLPAACAKLDAAPLDLRVAVGPCIQACCFEVSAEVARTIADATDPLCIVHASRNDAPPHVDLRRAIESQLRALGIDAFEHVGGCTRCDPRYHSYRRDGARSGRMLGFVQPRST